MKYTLTQFTLMVEADVHINKAILPLYKNAKDK